MHATPALAPAQSPAAPQYASSVDGSTHAPPHATSGGAHEASHAPWVQISPAPQLAPASLPVQSPLAPQWSRSVSGSTHVPPHATSPLWHDSSHRPAPLQISPAAHATPASLPVQSPLAPQWSRSVSGSMHVPSHAKSPLWHDSSHRPAPLQISPAAHATPASLPVQSPLAPQWSRSVSGSTHVPPHATSPLWHDSSHRPAPLQISPAAHATPASLPVQSPLAPQWSRSVSGSTHVPPHATSPLWHDSSHRPAPLQISPAAHATPASLPVQSPLAPQWSRSVSGSTHVPPHATSPLWHDSSHRPAPLQISPAAHATPASLPVQSPLAPQWSRSVSGSTHVPPHATSPLWHDSSHRPAPLQISPSAHASPASLPSQSPLAPQWSRSVSGSMHVPSHATSPLWHDSSHRPAPLQISPSAHATPASLPVQSPLAPQWSRSVSGSMHVLSHATSPLWHDSSHRPAPLQISPAAHVTPASLPVQSPLAPQWSRSVSGSMHVPSHATSPRWHDTAHSPAPSQSCPSSQETSHAPQWAASVARSAHTSPHNVCPVPHRGAPPLVSPGESLEQAARKKVRPRRKKIRTWGMVNLDGEPRLRRSNQGRNGRFRWTRTRDST
ncbi:hypothetical protein [Sorangium cellulosum]|uniref:hypothetical protein n=1 Tax=Sorangium cellulosum TaxID=56 RepID=UPI00067769EA|nr:hypothetical protein [Sorangium cellulosum]